ncbi:SO_0444 family Cu/Zn efflux transporter [Desulfonatronum parangueonense]
MTVFAEILSVALAAAPWLLLGLFAGGLVKAFVPESILKRMVGGRGFIAVARAAVVGAPLPLCSCGAIPAALALHRGGAGRGPTTAFLIGTPGIGVDSITITYALLGPFMAVIRALGAVVTALITGLLVAAVADKGASLPLADTTASCNGECSGGTCSGGLKPLTLEPAPSAGARLRGGMRFAFRDLLDDISAWIFAGLAIAGILIAFMPPEAMAAYGSGLLPMLFMAVVGMPLYICATAATPIAAGMLLVGVSPGTVLVFLLTSPVTSMATLGIYRREMGNKALGCYLFGIVFTAVLLGILVDQAVAWRDVDVVGQIGAVQEIMPQWLEWSSLAIFIVLAVRPVRSRIGSWFTRHP